MVTTVVHYTKEDPGSLVESCQRALERILLTHRSRPIRRCWIDADYTEEEITLLEEEVLPAMAAFLERVSEIEQRLEALMRPRPRLRPPGICSRCEPAGRQPPALSAVAVLGGWRLEGFSSRRGTSRW